MNLFSKKTFTRKLTYDWPFYLLSALLAIVFWRGAFGLLHRYKFYEKVELFVAASLEDTSLSKVIREQMDDEPLKSFEINQALPNDHTFLPKLHNVGYNYSDLLILPSSVYENILCDEVFLEINNSLIDDYLDEEKTLYKYNDLNYGFLIRNPNQTSWLDDFINFDIEESYYLFISGASKNIGNLGNFQTPEYDLALKCLKVLLK